MNTTGLNKVLTELMPGVEFDYQPGDDMLIVYTNLYSMHDNTTNLATPDESVVFDSIELGDRLEAIGAFDFCDDDHCRCYIVFNLTTM
jgi:hypothetical protein